MLNGFGKGRGAVRGRGLRGVGLGLMAACLALALGPGTGPEVRPAGGGAMVELDTGEPPLVALTFDDGPRNSTTGRLLEGLALREVPATFFLVGERIAGSEDLIREMAAAGHQIGIHTYDHVRVTELSHRDFDLQVSKTRALLTDILGEGDYWLRPPYGIVDRSVEQWADGPLILWSDIILMHDIYDTSVDATLRIVDELLERGYCFVTVEQLMDLRGVQPENGALYTSLPLKEN